MGIQSAYSPTPSISQPPIYPPPRISQDAWNEGVVYLGGAQPTVDAPPNPGATTTQTTHLIIHENEDNTKASTSQKAMEHRVVVMTP